MRAEDLLTAALVEANDQLLAMYDLTGIVGRSLDAHETVPVVLERLRHLLGAESVRITGDADFVSTYSSVPSVGSDTVTVEVSDAWGPDIWISAERRDRFGTAEAKMISAVGRLAASAIRVSELHNHRLRQALSSRELEAAAELARLALPSWRPNLGGADVYARSDPALDAGGDLFTFTQIGDVLHFAVGDVSGKGLPAAMVMTSVVSAANAAFGQVGDAGPGKALSTIDQWTYAYLNDTGLFVTMLVGSLDIRERRLRLASAGHSPVFWVSETGAVAVPAETPPLGVVPISAPLGWEVAGSDVNGMLVVGSDGLTEQVNHVGEMYGDDRLVDLLERSLGRPAAELGEHIFADVESFADGSSQSDDRTVLLLNCLEQRK